MEASGELEVRLTTTRFPSDDGLFQCFPPGVVRFSVIGPLIERL